MGISIATNLIQLAVDEGKDLALNSAQDIQLALESLVEIGSKEEKIAAAFLLLSVNAGIQEILAGTLVEMAKNS